ncbi:putative receptor-like protein kinase At3g47110 [Cryptomeria japonica]|uniref:putative receptor-like protein kinase At3g47110 n=1 Tax=Cryptomeria japonica TaxID=3369 RepID=UPI0027DA005C|nr:putative receptor-like protein kinase At3g47110 [Cryptomeria japonica]
MLSLLNFSYNNLSGSVPDQGAFRMLSATSFLGNPGLCAASGWLNLPNCTSSARIHSNGFNRKVIMVISISTVLALYCILGASYIFFRKTKRAPFKNSLPGRGFMRISSEHLHRAIEGFSAANLLGTGSFGSVYRGLLSDNTLVAVKVFDRDPPNSYKNFYEECRIMSKIRHQNLVKVLSCCSTSGFRALVLQFMSKGSLDQQLHQDCRLSLKMRLNIALDVAHAMAYLHNDFSPPIVHCDLKPSNVLMDENMTAHVVDFGVAHLMTSTVSARSSTSKLKGTVGYPAPDNTHAAQGVLNTVNMHWRGDQHVPEQE